jgi:hypothetical protein
MLIQYPGEEGSYLMRNEIFPNIGWARRLLYPSHDIACLVWLIQIYIPLTQPLRLQVSSVVSNAASVAIIDFYLRTCNIVLILDCYICTRLSVQSTSRHFLNPPIFAQLNPVELCYSCHLIALRCKQVYQLRANIWVQVWHVSKWAESFSKLNYQRNFFVKLCRWQARKEYLFRHKLCQDVGWGS